jgi:hypothetical protein
MNAANVNQLETAMLAAYAAAAAAFGTPEWAAMREAAKAANRAFAAARMACRAA